MSVYILKNEAVKANCIAEIEAAYKPYQVTIGTAKRSSSQNAYFHKLVEVISEFNGDDPEDIKMRIKYAVLPLREVKIEEHRGFPVKTYQYPISTTELDKKQFAALIDATMQLGMSLGLTMPLASHYGLEQ